MNTPLPNTFSLTKRPTYPHMRPHEALIWETFLTVISDCTRVVAYDVHVGTLPKAHQTAPASIKKHIAAVYPKKIDAAILDNDATLLIEVKPYAGIAALGQALAYPILFSHDFPDFPSPKPFILTDRAQPDMPELCRHFNITLCTYADLGTVGV